MIVQNRDIALEHIVRHRRTLVLCVLDDLPSPYANLPILLDIIRGVGCQSTEEQLRQDFIFLRDNGLVELEELNGLWKILLLRKGSDVVNGHEACEGTLRSTETRSYRLTQQK